MRNRFLGLIAVAAAVAVPRGLGAQDVHSWTLCTPGMFVSCHSVELSTLAIYSGGARTGTDVTVTMHNLNGQVASDNTLWSAIVEVFFNDGHVTNPGPVVGGVSGPLTLSGGAAGAATWSASFWTWHLQLNGVPEFSPSVTIGGCGAGPYPFGVTTCGVGAVASFSFETQLFLDATTFDGVSVWMDGRLPSGEGGPGSCAAGSMAGWDPTTCDILGESLSTVPEPVSLVLLGSGLFGIAAFRLQRRKRPVG